MPTKNITNTTLDVHTDEHTKLLVPNKKTIAAMEAARRGDLVTVGGIENLLDSLSAKKL